MTNLQVDLRISKNIKKFYFSYQEYLNHSEDLISKYCIVNRRMAKTSREVVNSFNFVRDGL